MLNLLLLSGEGTGTDNNQMYWLIGLIVLMVAVLVYSNYSNRKRRKQAEEVNSRLTVGSKVKTIGGLVGEIEEIDEVASTYLIRSGNSTFLIDKSAVYSMELFAGKGAVPTASSEQEHTEEAEAAAEEPAAAEPSAENSGEQSEADEQDKAASVETKTLDQSGEVKN